MIHELSPEVTDYVLGSQLLGHLGCASEGQALVLPVSYLYDGYSIYGQTPGGDKTRMLQKNPAVFFEVDEPNSPSGRRHVVVRGVYEELEGDERLYTEQRLGPGRMAAFNNHLAPETETVVFRIRILSKTATTSQDAVCQPS